MNRDREHLVRSLCHQILETHDEEGRPPPATSSGLLENAGGAIVRVEIEGIVKTMVRQIWIDNMALSQRIADEIQQQAAAINLDDLVRTKVRDSMQRAVADLQRKIDDEVQRLVRDAVREKMGKLPEQVAAKVARKLVHRAYDVD